MASPDLQAKADALSSKIEGEAKLAVDDIERSYLRKIARKSFACVVQCYDDAGTNGSANEIDNCSRSCQQPYQISHNVVQQVCDSFATM